MREEENHKRSKTLPIHKIFHQSFSHPINYLIYFIFSSVLLTGPSLVTGQENQAEKGQKQESKVKLEKIGSHVTVITISGLRADDLNNRAAYGHTIPTIESLQTKGAYAVSVESVYPSLAIPAHASIATGTLPADHGIRSDYPFSERSGGETTEPHFFASEIKTDTLWDAAKRNGLTTAAIGYPLTAGANINYNLPAAIDEPDSKDRQMTIDQISRREYVNPPDLLETVSAKADGRELTTDKTPKEIVRYQKTDYFRALSAAYIIEHYRPNLLMINFGSYARSMQKFGVQSKEASTVLTFIDGLINKIMTSIEQAQVREETTIFVLSDYGSMRIERLFKPNVLLAKNGWLTTGGNGRVVSWRAVAQTFGGSAAIFVKDPQDEKTIGEVEKLFAKCHEKPDSPIWRVISRREIRELGADPQAALYIDAAPSYGIMSRAVGTATSNAPDRATNGYLPTRSEARGTLIISGKGIRRDSKIEYARLIDIAPTVGRILGFEMRTARGRVLSEAFVK